MPLYPWSRFVDLYANSRHLDIFDAEDLDKPDVLACYLAGHADPDSIVQKFVASFGFAISAEGITVDDPQALRLAYVFEHTAMSDMYHHDRHSSPEMSMVEILGFHDAKEMRNSTCSIAELADLVSVILELPHDGDIPDITATEKSAMRQRADEWMNPQRDLPLAA